MFDTDRRNRTHNVRAYGSDAMTVFVVFLAVAGAVMAACVWLLTSYLSMDLMIGVAFVTGLIFSAVFGVKQAKKREATALNMARDMKNNKEAEMQKQIDTMQRKNSKIPKVTR